MSEQEWICPECGTRYTKNIGRCGDLQGCSQPNVIPAGAAGQWFGSIGGLITQNGKPIGNALDMESAKVISKAHNAALAAEHDREIELICELQRQLADDARNALAAVGEGK